MFWYKFIDDRSWNSICDVEKGKVLINVQYNDITMDCFQPNLEWLVCDINCIFDVGYHISLYNENEFGLYFYERKKLCIST